MIPDWMRGITAAFAAVVVAAVLASGCAVREERPAGAWLAERDAWFAEHPVWSVSGRVGLSDGKRGGSLAFTWRARGDHHRIFLRTSTGGKQWQLVFRPDYAVLEGSDVDRLIGNNPDPLVEAAVGWPIPVRDLAWWIRGLLPPGSSRPEYAADGSLESASAPPWQLEFQRFGEVGGVLLPQRLQAQSDSYRVRLVLRDWHWGVNGN